MYNQKIESITDQLIARADKQLENDVEAAAKPLYDLLCNGCQHTVKIPGLEPEVIWFHAFAALKRKAVELGTAAARQKEIDGFMQKVETVQQQIDEITGHLVL